MEQYDESLLEKVPDDYDVNKIGFILVYENSTSDTQEDDMDIDYELTPNIEPSNSNTTTCHICKNTYINRSNLKRHLSTVHSGKVYECTICKEKFDKQRQYSYHLRLHKKEKSQKCHKCYKCGKFYNTRSALIVHQETHHQQLTDIEIDDIFP